LFREGRQTNDKLMMVIHIYYDMHIIHPKIWGRGCSWLESEFNSYAIASLFALSLSAQTSN
jgi:hypothetical protein